MAIAFDAASKSKKAGTSTLSWTHICTGSNLFLFVGIHTTSSVPTGVTYGGNALDKIFDQTIVATDSITGWGKIVSAGTANIEVSWAGSQTVVCGAASYTGVNQTTPTDVAAKASGNSGTATVNVNSAVGDLVICAMGDFTHAVVVNETERWEQECNANYSYGSEETGAASVTMSWTKDSSGWWGIGGVSLNPAEGGQSYSYTMQGGSLAGGLALFSRIRPFTMLGGAIVGGTPSWLKIQGYFPSGGAIVGGSPLWSRLRNYLGSGGAVVGGASVWSRVRNWIVTGGGISGGSALFQKLNNFFMAGGSLGGGSAPYQWIPITPSEVKEAFVNVFRRRRRN